MKLADFKVEQWMNENEGQAKYNLTDTCASSFSMEQLLRMVKTDLSKLVLDYGEIQGSLAFRQQILSLYKTGSEENITTTNGCLEANVLVMETLLEPQDHVIACVPGYQQFVSYPQSLGCTVSTIQLLPESLWQPNLQDFLDAIQDHTKLIVLNNPNNPTGTQYQLPFLEELIKVCDQRGIYILCDEVYRDPNRLPSISDLYQRGISTSSLSKVYGLAGLRLGWIKAKQDLITKINSRRDYTMISTGPLLDALGTAALENKESILQRTNAILDQNRTFLKEWLKDQDIFDCVIPENGTVCFLEIKGMKDSVKTAQYLLKEHGIFFVPGACFDQEGFMRLGLGQDPNQFKEGLIRLTDILKSKKGL